MKWIRDDEFIRGNCPMTKFEIRVLTIAMLGIEEGDILLDIGAGTGSVSIEAALNGAKVYSIEMKDEGIELINKNADKFAVEINAIKGTAPEGIDVVPRFNKCFIGGSGKHMASIFERVHNKLEPGGIVAANFVTLNNLSEFRKLLKDYSYKGIETRLIQTASEDSLTGIMKANNPVYIVKGVK